MGYESRIYVVNTSKVVFDSLDFKPYGEKIAIFNLSNMGTQRYNGMMFTDLFDKINNCSIYADDGNTEILEDKYGDMLRYTTDIEKVINWLEASEADDSYRRAELFLNFLKVLNQQIKTNVWMNEIRLVHYGY